MNHHVAEEEKEHTHVLIIGNGFDIEHGLNTKYKDFFKCLEDRECTKNVNNAKSTTVQLCLKIRSLNSGCNVDVEGPFDKGLLEKNLWYHHFSYLIEKKFCDENWFNLEQEIYEAVVELNKLYKENINNSHKSEKKFQKLKDCWSELCRDKKLCRVIEDIKQDLDRLIDQLDLYLRKEADCLSKESDIKLKLENCLEENARYKLMVLDFNYTRVFERLYVKQEQRLKKTLSQTYKNLSEQIDFCYVHGHTGAKRMFNKFYVLGCQDFKPEDNIDPIFNDFTKKKQREKFEKREKQEKLEMNVIYEDKCENGKICSIEFKDFRDKLEKYQNITFHIIGHSLGETDHDILKEILGFQNSRIRVYYHNEEAHRRLKENMIHIIGEEAVKDGTRVKFICQYDPQEGVFPSRCFKYWVNIG